MGEMMAGELPQIVFEESVTSTNDVAIERGREGAPHGWCVCAQEQTEGRGRRGHVWASPAGSLYLSCVPPTPQLPACPCVPRPHG